MNANGKQSALINAWQNEKNNKAIANKRVVCYLTTTHVRFAIVQELLSRRLLNNVDITLISDDL